MIIVFVDIWNEAAWAAHPHEKWSVLVVWTLEQWLTFNGAAMIALKTVLQRANRWVPGLSVLCHTIELNTLAWLHANMPHT